MVRIVVALFLCLVFGIFPFGCPIWLGQGGRLIFSQPITFRLYHIFCGVGVLGGVFQVSCVCRSWYGAVFLLYGGGVV